MNKGCATVYMAGIATVKQFTPICHSVTVVKMPGRVRKDFFADLSICYSRHAAQCQMCSKYEMKAILLFPGGCLYPVPK